MAELLNCPFCNEEADTDGPDEDGYWRIICACSGFGPLRRTEAEAIAAWNTRAFEQSLPVSTEAGLRKAARYLMPYLDWTIGPESPGHHPTMPSAVAAFKEALSLPQTQPQPVDHLPCNFCGAPYMEAHAADCAGFGAKAHGMPGDDVERREMIAQITKEVADLPGAIERCQRWCDSQNVPLSYGQSGPPITFADVRALLAALRPLDPAEGDVEQLLCDARKKISDLSRSIIREYGLAALADEVIKIKEAIVSIDAALAALPRHADRGWQDISAAPYNTPVEVRAGRMTFVARLLADHAIGENEQSCDQWVAEHEDEHPPCWTDGACWESNANEVMSIQPDGWRALRQLAGERG